MTAAPVASLALYHNDMSVCAAKVRLVLAEKGLEWESRHRNLRAGDVALTPYVERFAQLGFGDAIQGHPGVVAWADKVAARANNPEGIGRWINPAYTELFASVRGDAAAWLRTNMAV